MAKQKTIPELEAEKAKNEHKLSQLQHHQLLREAARSLCMR